MGTRKAPPPKRPVHRSYVELPPSVALEKGQEMGRFLLGSTVILLFPAGRVEWDENYLEGSPTRLGQSLGAIRA